MLTTTAAFGGYSVRDTDEALAFYRDVLGVDAREAPMGVELHVTGGAPIFLYGKNDHEPASFTVLNFEVPDIDAAAEELAAAGVELLRYEGLHQDERGIARGREAGYGPDIAWFADPSGNVLSILRS